LINCKSTFFKFWVFLEFNLSWFTVKVQNRTFKWWLLCCTVGRYSEVVIGSSLTVHRCTSLYARYRDSKNRLAYNEFAYIKTKEYHKLEDRFQKRPVYNCIYAKSKIKRPNITRAAWTWNQISVLLYRENNFYIFFSKKRTIYFESKYFFHKSICEITSMEF